MKKKSLSLILCATLVFGLAACGSTKKEKKNDSSSGEIVLEFPSWQATEPGFQEFWEEAVAEFEKRNENVKINLYQVPFDSYVDTLTTLYAADTPPQITHIPSRYFAQFSDMGWFEPLNDRLKQTDIIENWSNLQDGLQVDGKYYGVLLLGNGYSMYYNKAMFDEAGIDVPTDVNSFMEAAKTLTKDENGDGDPEIYGFGACQVTDTNFYNEATSFVVGLGGKWSENGNLTPMTSDTTKEALKLYQSLFVNNYTPTGLSVEQKRQYFVEGKMAMIFDGPWVASLINDAAEEVKENLLVTTIPFESVPGSMSNSLHIPATISDKEKELVWEFIQMVTENDFQKLYMEKVGSPSPSKTAIDDEVLEENPFLGQFVKDAEKAQEILPSGYEKDYGEFTQYIIDGVMTMVTDPYADVATTLDDMKTKITNELGK
ncbi:ABC transporter substrate-binding protein [Muricomes intestini]|jgi:multiple sugar transport system substrate-binding protein|uniref:Carbohydrate ABC transporter substrate-binding protein (CUT1 family) n=2 Tax=Muricomes intestini TaxID=1796634 RepID=A0A4R3K0Z4_9FIRM|nr:sugar ABC transporter substrate-binding protein [Muricomes intestini]TCS75035.1 carbohydrate ABC transporter substrate-binding protein (CUT1 family) [Muricomes intestini]